MGGASRSGWVFAGLAALATLLLGRILLPLLMPVLLGAFLVVLFQPVHRWLSRRLPGQPTLSATLSASVMIGALLIPFGVVAVLVARELPALAHHAESLLRSGALHDRLAAQLPDSLEHLGLVLPQGAELERALVGALSLNAAFAREVVGSSTSLLLQLFLMAVSAYYFFRDGHRMLEESERLIPLPTRHFQAFCSEFAQTARALSYGTILTGLVQGAVGLLGLWLVGVSHAPLWAAAMTLCAFVPVGGTALVWGPISLVLLMQGRTQEGFILIGWGSLLVGTIDNVLRPRLCSSRMSLHPLLVFLSIFGGLSVFGMVGLLVGPLIASFFGTVVRIYRRDYLGLREPEPQATPEPAPSRVSGSPLVSGQPAKVG